MKSWKKWFGIVTGLLLTGYFLFFIFGTYKSYDVKTLLKPGLFQAILVAAFINLLLVPLAGLAWAILLRGMGSHWKPTKLSAIIGITQIAKYVPGNIAQHIGRTTVALMAGIPGPIFISSVLVESILLLLASVFTGFLCLGLSSVVLPVIDIPFFHKLPTLIFILVASALALPIAIYYFPKLFQHFSRLKNFRSVTLPSPPTTASLVQAFLLYCLSYSILGLTFWIIASQYNEYLQFDFFALTASFSLAWLIGYLAPGAPAGLGVREGSLTFLLSNVGPAEHVLTIVIATRFATILSDAICFIISACFMKYNENEKPEDN